MICRKIINFLSEWIKSSNSYPKNSIRSFIGRKVYLENGHSIGKVTDVILGNNKIEDLKVKIDKKYKFKAKGIIVDYKHVKGVSEIIILDEEVAEHLENFACSV